MCGAQRDAPTGLKGSALSKPPLVCYQALNRQPRNLFLRQVHAADREAAAALQAQKSANLKRHNAVMEDLCRNGYLRARMVRARLLHYFIARLVGARRLYPTVSLFDPTGTLPAITHGCACLAAQLHRCPWSPITCGHPLCTHLPATLNLVWNCFPGSMYACICCAFPGYKGEHQLACIAAQPCFCLAVLVQLCHAQCVIMTYILCGAPCGCRCLQVDANFCTKCSCTMEGWGVS